MSGDRAWRLAKGTRAQSFAIAYATMEDLQPVFTQNGTFQNIHTYNTQLVANRGITASPSAGTFTITTAGVYTVCYSNLFILYAEGPYGNLIQVVKNGVGIFGTLVNFPSDPTMASTVGNAWGPVPLQLAVNDVIGLQTSINGSAITELKNFAFTMVRIA